MSVKERLISFIKTKKIGQAAFEKKVGLSNGYINNMRKSLGTEKLENILRTFPDLNKNWLLYGEGEMLIEENSNDNLTSVQQDTPPNYGDLTTGKLFEYISSLVDSSNILAKSNEKLAASNQQLVENNRQLVETNNEMNRKLMELIHDQGRVKPGTAEAV